MTDGAERYGKVVADHGLSPTHLQVIDWVPRGSRVLELGCATGYIGRILMREKGCRVTGVEVDLAAAEVARANGLEVHTGSLEDEAFRTSLGTGYDIVIAADVLEHLANPAPVLEHFKRWLTPASASAGNLAPRGIVAVPNLATWSIRAQLFFRGDFEYQDTGISTARICTTSPGRRFTSWWRRNTGPSRTRWWMAGRSRGRTRFYSNCRSPS